MVVRCSLDDDISFQHRLMVWGLHCTSFLLYSIFENNFCQIVCISIQGYAVSLNCFKHYYRMSVTNLLLLVTVIYLANQGWGSFRLVLVFLTGLGYNSHQLCVIIVVGPFQHSRHGINMWQYYFENHEKKFCGTGSLKVHLNSLTYVFHIECS